ncbi:hypothetical protein SAMN05216328_13450 [Ensifer sp. YR511]|nr:hypothetical protein SAMN05216328_13450 [Ensifer sp. YR511]
MRPPSSTIASRPGLICSSRYQPTFRFTTSIASSSVSLAACRAKIVSKNSRSALDVSMRAFKCRCFLRLFACENSRPISLMNIVTASSVSLWPSLMTCAATVARRRLALKSQARARLEARPLRGSSGPTGQRGCGPASEDRSRVRAGMLRAPSIPSGLTLLVHLEQNAASESGSGLSSDQRPTVHRGPRAFPAPAPRSELPRHGAGQWRGPPTP